MIKFDGRHFFTINGSQLAVMAVHRADGRWLFRRSDTNKLIASGMTPDQFVREFWFSDMEFV